MWSSSFYVVMFTKECKKIIKKEDFIPKAPVRITSKKQIAEEISSMVEAIMPSQNSAENHNER